MEKKKCVHKEPLPTIALLPMLNREEIKPNGSESLHTKQWSSSENKALEIQTLANLRGQNHGQATLTGPGSSYALDQALQLLSSHSMILIGTKSLKSLPSSKMQSCWKLCVASYFPLAYKEMQVSCHLPPATREDVGPGRSVAKWTY